MSFRLPLKKNWTFSQFHLINSLFALTIERPLVFLMGLYVGFFIFDLTMSSFLPGSFSLYYPMLHFFLGAPFILFLFFELFPACIKKNNLSFLFLRLIDLVILLTLAKHIFLGGQPAHQILGGPIGMLYETLRLLEFAFFAFMCWSFRQFAVGLQRIISVKSILFKTQVSHDHISLSPHLLFNALNNIAGKSALFSDELFHQIGALSALLQQAYKDPDDPHYLSDEVSILHILLFLAGSNKKRFSVLLHIEHELPLEYFKIPRLTLGTLMENILKYGVLDDPDNPAEMNISVKRDLTGNAKLTCTTSNLIHPIKAGFSSSHGLSTLENVINHNFQNRAIFEWGQNLNEFSTLMILPYGKIETGTH
ncbi:hypothetical protein U3A58_19950 [Algoriphagus sp. C2-6-M1]|uniref:hypothetical protein n=1 Tax=Algoriphagus persicinus TaxID=3108754 RepID=UPI002B3F7B58|nr:hypothetical protein [Algoriphagus sp. C2-6-M1]MEB2782672.1 hypothetical protein [Algoriphagus sp. C2-6-M1]